MSKGSGKLNRERDRPGEYTSPGKGVATTQPRASTDLVLTDLSPYCFFLLRQTGNQRFYGC